MADSGPPPAPIHDPDRPVPQGPLDIAAMIAAIPTQSPTVTQIVEALGQAMTIAPRPKLTKTALVETTGRNYSYKYATLGDCMASLTGPLDQDGKLTIDGKGAPVAPPSAFSFYGLTITHQPIILGRQMYLLTKIWHRSGEFIACVYPVINDINVKPQAIGSAMTYARRYSIMALTGLVAEEDDDGQAAQAGTEQRGERRAEPKADVKAEPKVRRQTRAEAEAEAEPAIEEIQAALVKDGVVPTERQYTRIIKWYEAKMAAAPDLPALSEFWQANVNFARALYAANKEVGGWIKDSYDTRTKSLTPKEAA